MKLYNEFDQLTSDIQANEHYHENENVERMIDTIMQPSNCCFEAYSNYYFRIVHP